MNERIREFLLAENKSSAQLADEINVQPSGISHILSGRNNPSLDFVLKMLEKYDFLSTDWLLFGKGSMYKESASPSLFDNSIISPGADVQGEKNSFNMKNMNEAHSVVNESVDGRTANTERKPEKVSAVEKIVWFYNDNSFEEYFPAH